MTRSRWPGWVYRTGEEPDYRFSFANERTFLAWIRTALALIAAGVAIDAINLSMSPDLKKAFTVVLVLLGLVCAVSAWGRWAMVERAMRQGAALPGSPLLIVLALGVVVVAIGMLAMLA